MGERETARPGGEGGGGPPLAGLSGVVRMMNGRPAWAVRALMGAAELYITLLSVCERLLKALKSQSLRRSRPTSRGPDPRRRLRSQRPSDGRRPPQVREAAGRGEDGCDSGMDRLFPKNNVG